MPSGPGLAYIANLVVFVGVAYYISLRQLPTARGIVAFLLFVVGAIGCIEGFVLGAREDSRLRYGTVVPGIVVEKYRTDGRGHAYSTQGREGPSPGRSGFLITEALAHRIAYGSFAIRMVDYRYPCGVGTGTCFERDYVSPEYWDRLSVGDSVNVRQGEGETGTARLDENPQAKLALAQVAVSALFLLAARWAFGRVALPWRRKYLTAPAVVTAVQQVDEGGEMRWRVKFAYFDRNGDAQESADHVSVPVLKPGDDCLAVYRPESPQEASLQTAGS